MTTTAEVLVGFSEEKTSN